MINLFRNMKMDTFPKMEPYQIKTWTELLVQLTRIVAEYNDLDPTRVPDLPEFHIN